MSDLLLPNSELVTVAWLKSLDGIPTNGVGTTLPAASAWAADGFVQVSVAGGAPDRDLPVARPVMSVDCWANNPNSARPPWGKAAQLAEVIRAACYRMQNDPDPTQQILTMHVAGYQRAVLYSAYWVSEPRRRPADEARFARIGGDLQIHWAVVP